MALILNSLALFMKLQILFYLDSLGKRSSSYKIQHKISHTPQAIYINYTILFSAKAGSVLTYQ